MQDMYIEVHRPTASAALPVATTERGLLVLVELGLGRVQRVVCIASELGSAPAGHGLPRVRRQLTPPDSQGFGDRLVVAGEGSAVAQEASLRVHPTARAVKIGVPREHCPARRGWVSVCRSRGEPDGPTRWDAKWGGSCGVMWGEGRLVN